MTKAGFALCFLIAAAQPALPASIFDPFPTTSRTLGVGENSCGTWVTHNKDAILSLTQSQWLLGYLTAAEAYEGFTVDIVDNQTFVTWVNDYCSAQPLSKVADAAYALVFVLRAMGKK